MRNINHLRVGRFKNSKRESIESTNEEYKLEHIQQFGAESGIESTNEEYKRYLHEPCEMRFSRIESTNEEYKPVRRGQTSSHHSVSNQPTRNINWTI